MNNMFITGIPKCFKVNSMEEKDLLTILEGDVVYIRNHPFVYLNLGSDKGWQKFSKVYVSPSHPKYNMDRTGSLAEPYMFKIDNMESLEAVPAKPGDLIYRDGDEFMYMKKDSMAGGVKYDKILKL